MFARSSQYQSGNPSALIFKSTHYLLSHWFPNQPGDLSVQPKSPELPFQPDALKGGHKVVASDPTLCKTGDMNALLDQGEGNEGQFIRILQRAEAPANVQAKDTGKLCW